MELVQPMLCPLPDVGLKMLPMAPGISCPSLKSSQLLASEISHPAMHAQDKPLSHKGCECPEMPQHGSKLQPACFQPEPNGRCPLGRQLGTQ